MCALRVAQLFSVSQLPHERATGINDTRFRARVHNTRHGRNCPLPARGRRDTESERPPLSLASHHDDTYGLLPTRNTLQIPPINSAAQRGTRAGGHSVYRSLISLLYLSNSASAAFTASLRHSLTTTPTLCHTGLNTSVRPPPFENPSQSQYQSST